MKIPLTPTSNQIYQSAKGTWYAPPQRLETKKRVYSQAILQKIPHKTKDKIDICLKIGRYDILGEVETENPKSELTLSDSELNKLIEYLQIYYKPLELDATKFVTIESKSTRDLLLKFKSLVGSDEDAAKQLLDSGILSDNIYLAIDLIKKKQALEEFSSALSENKLESFWQDWFENNKWILGSEYLKILNERKIDTAHIADYLVKTFDGFMDIVEIKKPNGLKFWADTKDHDNYVPSSDLIKAITQCQRYLLEIERESNSTKFLKDHQNVQVIKPRCLLIFGRSNDWGEDKQEAFRMLNASLNQISILTYDHLLLRAENILEISHNEESDEDIPF